MPFLIGMVISIPFYLLYWSLFESFFNNWTGGGLFFYHFLNRDGIGALYITAALILINLFLFKRSESSALRELTGYVGGMLFTLSLYDFLVFEEWFGALELFTVPFVRIVYLFMLPFLLNRFLLKTDWKKYLWLGFAMVLPFLLTTLPVLSVMNNVSLAIVLAVILSVFSAFMYIMESQERL